MKMPVFIGIVGQKKSGKTTLIEKLVKEMTLREKKVGTIKATTHELEFDAPGKDTYRHRAAGADVTLIKSMPQIAFFSDSDYVDENIIRAIFAKCDFVFVEGESDSKYPKIHVVDERDFRDDVTGPILAVWGSGKGIDGLPFFNKDQCGKLCEFIINKRQEL